MSEWELALWRDSVILRRYLAVLPEIATRFSYLTLFASLYLNLETNFSPIFLILKNTRWFMRASYCRCLSIFLTVTTQRAVRVFVPPPLVFFFACSMRFVSNQRKIRDYFFQKLIVYIMRSPYNLCAPSPQYFRFRCGPCRYRRREDDQLFSELAVMCSYLTSSSSALLMQFRGVSTITWLLPCHHIIQYA
jgi:hypothetical protein